MTFSITSDALISWHRRQVTQESFDRAVQEFGLENTSLHFCVTDPVCEHIWKMEVTDGIMLADGSKEYLAWNRCGLCGLESERLTLEGARQA